MEIEIIEKYPDYFEANLDWVCFRSEKVEILIDTFKELVWDCMIRIYYLKK